MEERTSIPQNGAPEMHVPAHSMHDGLTNYFFVHIPGTMHGTCIDWNGVWNTYGLEYINMPLE